MVAIQREAAVREQGVTIAIRVHALRHQDREPRGVDVGVLVVEAERHLDLAGAHTEPLAPAIVEERPVEAGRRILDVAVVAREQLDACAQAIGDLRRGIEPGLEQLEAAARGRTDVVIRGRDERALTHESVDLDRVRIEACGSRRDRSFRGRSVRLGLHRSRRRRRRRRRRRLGLNRWLRLGGLCASRGHAPRRSDQDRCDEPAPGRRAATRPVLHAWTLPAGVDEVEPATWSVLRQRERRATRDRASGTTRCRGSCPSRCSGPAGRLQT